MESQRQAMMRARNARQIICIPLESNIVFDLIPRLKKEIKVRILTSAMDAVQPPFVVPGKKATEIEREVNYALLQRHFFGTPAPAPFGLPNLVDPIYAEMMADGSCSRFLIEDPPKPISITKIKEWDSLSSAVALQFADDDEDETPNLAWYMQNAIAKRYAPINLDNAVNHFRLTMNYERKNRSKQLIPFILADCARMGVDVSRELVIITDADCTKQNREMQIACVRAGLHEVLTDIHFFQNKIYEYDGDDAFWQEMVKIFADLTETKSGSDVASEHAFKLARQVRDRARAVDQDIEEIISNKDSPYATMLTYLFTACNDTGAELEVDDEDLDQELDIYQYRRLWPLCLSFTAQNVQTVANSVIAAAKAFRDADPEGKDYMDYVRQCSKAMGYWDRLFRTDFQRVFRALMEHARMVQQQKLTDDEILTMLRESYQKILQRKKDSDLRHEDIDAIKLHITHELLKRTKMPDGIHAPDGTRSIAVKDDPETAYTSHAIVDADRDTVHEVAVDVGEFLYMHRRFFKVLTTKELRNSTSVRQVVDYVMGQIAHLAPKNPRVKGGDLIWVLSALAKMLLQGGQIFNVKAEFERFWSDVNKQKVINEEQRQARREEQVRIRQAEEIEAERQARLAALRRSKKRTATQAYGRVRLVASGPESPERPSDDV